MKEQKKNTVVIASQLVGSIVQGFAIIVFFITVLLVFDRCAVCSFYEIPTVYSSLDPVSIIPAVPIMLPLIIIFIAIIRDSKESSDEISPYLNYGFTGIITKSLMDLGIAIIFLILVNIWSSKYKFSAQIPINSSKFIYRPLIYKCLCFMAHTILWLATSFFFVHIKREYNFNKIESETHLKDSTFFADLVKGNFLMVRIKLVAMICVLLISLPSCISMLEIMTLTSQKNYGIVELDNEKGAQLYAVVLNLEQYYVLEPIEEDGEEITINTERYIYKERDSVEVTQRFFRRVYMNWYTDSVPNEYMR